jgi:type 1 glutamine amidotransferase
MASGIPLFGLVVGVASLVSVSAVGQVEKSLPAEPAVGVIRTSSFDPTVATAERQPPTTQLRIDFDPYDQSQVPLEVEPPADYKGKRILLVAGRASHGPGEHEFFAGCVILAKLLRQNANVFPILARDGWPKNEKLLETADCIVLYMDGGGGHPAIQPKRMELIQRQIDRGVGWVNLHYAVEYPVRQGTRDIAGPVKRWLGGYYETGYSINPHWDADIRSLPKHPITRGVTPFRLRDEWYYGIRFLEDLRGVTPILQAVPPDNTRRTEATKLRAGQIETLAWAYERPDGGRSFGFTGGHFHRNWGSEHFRRIVVNAILWCAKEEVPSQGAKVAFDPIDLNRHLDRKGKGEFRPILPPTPDR